MGHYQSDIKMELIREIKGIKIMDSINFAESDDIDTLAMRTQSGNWVYLANCPEDKYLISFVSSAKQTLLTKEEAIFVINGLQDCIKEMKGE